LQSRNIFAMAILLLALTCAAQTKLIPAEANIRFSEQLSNGPAGNCGCFVMEGAGGDFAWTLHRYGVEHLAPLSAVADVSAEHTGSVDGAPYGLTLTTFAAGPRIALPAGKSAVFAQSLFGITHGSGSEFPESNGLAASANSFALDLGSGIDYPLIKPISLRLLQIEYLRTSLPNDADNWQNNLRLSAGLTIRFAH
jgi:hypothetical protein